MNDLLAALRGERGRELSPLFVHAHPDDETLWTGGLLAWCADSNIDVDVLTITRGEQGEIVPGTLPAEITADDLVKVRERELSEAMAVLGVTSHYWLGTPPARSGMRAPRRYHDSGMTWVSEGIAGPMENDDRWAFAQADLVEAVEDLAALVRHLETTVLVTYDAQGSYGHPDHVRAHEITHVLGHQMGLPVIEIASCQGLDGFDYVDVSEYRERIADALRCYRTQLTVHDGYLVHVGGQRQELPVSVGLRQA